MKPHILITLLSLFLVNTAFSEATGGATGSIPQTNNADSNLTDDEKWQSKTYIHTGKNQRIEKEKCANLKDSRACRGRGGNTFLGMDSSMVTALSSAYSMVIGMMGMGGGGDFKLKPATENVTTTGEEAAKKADSGKETKKDYCKYFAVASEVIGKVQSMAGQAELKDPTAGNTNQQKKLLYKAAASHASRAKAAKIQTAGWGSTTACYVYQMTAGGIVIDWSVGLKASAAGLLTLFWAGENKANEEYSREVKGIADSMPGAGDCNPITDRECYCSEESTKNDPKYCVPELHALSVKSGSVRVACTTAQLKADPKCNCINTNSCYDKIMMADFETSTFGRNFLNSAEGGYARDLMRGELSSAAANAYSSGKYASKKLNLLANKDPELKADLTSTQRKRAALIEKMGIPKSAALKLAALPITPTVKANSKKLSRYKFRRPRKKYKSKDSTKNSKVLTFKSGGSNQRRNSRPDNSMNSFMKKFGKNKRKKGNNSKVIKFANRAANSAQITKNKDRPIFEIISRRYQVSGRRLLELK